jgi:hypothetical protein
MGVHETPKELSVIGNAQVKQLVDDDDAAEGSVLPQ